MVDYEAQWGSQGSFPTWLGLGRDSKGMTPFDTEPEFWYCRKHTVTLGNQFSSFELQTF